MISYIQGEISEISAESAVIDVGGVGYCVLISAKEASRMPSVGSVVRVYTYLSVREDAMKLYGFLTKEDLDFFKLLITVNKVGPKVAQDILSVMEPQDLRMAILSGDAKTIAKCPGVGPKTAQRIILDLKDKVDIEEALDIAAGVKEGGSENEEARGDAMEALIALGFPPAQCIKAVRAVENADALTAEEIISAALKNMG